MDTSTNDRLNTMNESVEAKKKIDNAIQRLEEVYEHITEISNGLNNFNKTWAEFENHLDGMSNVFDGVKEKVKEVN